MCSDLRIDLSSMPSYGFGLIVLDPRGALYENQTGGTSTNHRKEKGYFLPIMREQSGWCKMCEKYYHDESGADVACSLHSCSCALLEECDVHKECSLKIAQKLLERHFYYEYNCGNVIGLYPESVKYINKVFSKNQETAFLELDQVLLGESHEAWLYVNIIPKKISPEPWAHIIDIETAARAVLTWQNSD